MHAPSIRDSIVLRDLIFKVDLVYPDDALVWTVALLCVMAKANQARRQKF
jgi:hypothetical protein